MAFHFIGAPPIHLAKGALTLSLFLKTLDCCDGVVLADVDLPPDCWLPWCGCRAAPRRALAATHAGQGLNRDPRFSGDLGNLPVLGLDIGLGEQIPVDVVEFRARYLAVRGARPVLIEDIEEYDLVDAANGGTSSNSSISGMLIDAPHISTNRRRRSERALIASDRYPTMRSARPEAPCAE